MPDLPDSQWYELYFSIHRFNAKHLNNRPVDQYLSSSPYSVEVLETSRLELCSDVNSLAAHSAL